MKTFRNYLKESYSFEINEYLNHSPSNMDNISLLILLEYFYSTEYKLTIINDYYGSKNTPFVQITLEKIIKRLYPLLKDYFIKVFKKWIEVHFHYKLEQILPMIDTKELKVYTHKHLVQYTSAVSTVESYMTILKNIKKAYDMLLSAKTLGDMISAISYAKNVAHHSEKNYSIIKDYGDLKSDEEFQKFDELSNLTIGEKYRLKKELEEEIE